MNKIIISKILLFLSCLVTFIQIPVSGMTCEPNDTQSIVKSSAIMAKDSLEIEHCKKYYGVVSGIEENTRHNDMTDGWNLYGVLAFIIALFSLLIGWYTLKAQKRTEQHTQKAPLEAQMGMLRDLPRHFYRNLSCTCAALLKFRHENNISDGRRKKYPSEANILKLTTLSDEYILPIDAVDAKVYKEMHEEKLLFKNYNLEVESAAKHFANSHISDDSLKNDYDNLLFKPLFLIAKTYRLQDAITESDKSYSLENNVPYSILSFVMEHFEKLDSMKKLIENKNGEIKYLEEIWNNSAFDAAIGGDGVWRGFGFLMNSDNKNDGKVSFLQYTKDKNGNYDKNAKIDKSAFIEHFKIQSMVERKSKAMEQFEKILITTDEAYFANNYKIEDSQKRHELYALLKPYFAFFKQDTWDAKELLFTILKIDTILEIGNIGMIDY